MGWWLAAWLATGCGPTAEPGEVEPESPEERLVPASMFRLNDAEFRATVQATFGVEYQGILPRDYVLHGYSSVGSGAVSVSPSELEAYEQTAWEIATEAVSDASSAAALLGCSPTLPLGQPFEPGRAEACVVRGVTPLASRAWRRPVLEQEMDRLVKLWSDTHDLTDSPVVATQALVSALMLSPEFLYRVEVGEPDPERSDEARRYTAWELASRLSFFLTDAPPDEPLRADAATGALHEESVLLAHAERLFETPQARMAMGRFWEETLELSRLDAVSKDADDFPEFDAALREAMKDEMRQLFEHVVFDTEQPFGALLTTEVTSASPNLAAVYGLPVGADSVEGTERGGILGRAALLSIWSHVTASSPTLRGKFVRTRLLCQAVPPPPEGVEASLESVTGEGSARDRLLAHSADPACRGCHEVMDPAGYALEHFDAIGRWRATDDGYAIDPSGDLDGIEFSGALELGAAVAAHPEFPGCVALQLWRHAMGVAEGTTQLPAIERLGEAFEASDQSLRALVLAMVASDVFRVAEPPEGSSLGSCGSGVEVCNGLDDDCDGDIDEDVILECTEDGAVGVSDCSLATCTVPLEAAEVCNGVDDDRDGGVDEGSVLVSPIPTSELASLVDDCDAVLGSDEPGCRRAANLACFERCEAHGFPTSVTDGIDHAVTCVSAASSARLDVSFPELVAYHAACSESDPFGGPCSAAIHRMCGQTGWRSGWGPVEHDDAGASIVCVDDASIVSTTYTTLSGSEPPCDGVAERLGPSCNRAIHRFCQDEGFASGFGPVENTGDTAVVACIGEAP